jgi:hypothetical protein
MVFRIKEDDQKLEIFGGNQEITDQILTLGYENQLSLLGLGTISLFLVLHLVKMALFATL